MGRTEKIQFGICEKRDKNPKGIDQTVLYVAENLTLKGIPLSIYEYVVNDKSTIGQLMNRYKVTKDKASGVANGSNECSDDPSHIVDSVKRVVRVLLETFEIINTRPNLNEKP